MIDHPLKLSTFPEHPEYTFALHITRADSFLLTKPSRAPHGILRFSARDSVHNSADRYILTETGNFPCSLLVYSHYPTSMWHPHLRIMNGDIEIRRPIATTTALIVVSM